jgi:molybdenum cofactor sulfurtransferase
MEQEQTQPQKQKQEQRVIGVNGNCSISASADHTTFRSNRNSNSNGKDKDKEIVSLPNKEEPTSTFTSTTTRQKGDMDIKDIHIRSTTAMMDQTLNNSTRTRTTTIPPISILLLFLSFSILLMVLLLGWFILIQKKKKKKNQRNDTFKKRRQARATAIIHEHGGGTIDNTTSAGGNDEDYDVLQIQKNHRKQKFLEFLTHHVEHNDKYNNYNYRTFETRRRLEFPHLISPIVLPNDNNVENNDNAAIISTPTKPHHPQTQQQQNNQHNQEVYLDYAGAGLVSQSQWKAIHKSQMDMDMQSGHNVNTNNTNNTMFLGNPHSTMGGPASGRTSTLMEQAKTRVLQHFDCFPDHAHGFGIGLSKRNNSNSSHNNIMNTTHSHGSHPGYEVIFTSGTTEALRIIATAFPWKGTGCGRGNNDNDKCEVNDRSTSTHSCNTRRSTSRSTHSSTHSSTLVYPHNAHTSVIGMRAMALQAGARFQCVPLNAVAEATPDTFRQWAAASAAAIPIQHHEHGDDDDDVNDDADVDVDVDETIGNGSTTTIKHLLVMPLECNFGGDTLDCQHVCRMAREADANANTQEQKHHLQQDEWFTVVDMARAASHNSSIHLKQMDPDFACLSFYKLFGYPTGVGALFVKRTARVMNLLLPHQEEEGHEQSHQHQRQRQYFGGGSMDMLLAHQDVAVPRSSLSAGAYSHGTAHYHGIAALVHGFDELERAGGMDMTRIHTHVSLLTLELVRRLTELRHTNYNANLDVDVDDSSSTGTTGRSSSRPAIVLYGAWGDVPQNTLDCVSDDHLSELILFNNLPGPTVAFNILRHDGSYVGYNEVSKLAMLNHPPIQLRTGCCCNPGACQRALGWTDDELIHHHQTMGHTCAGDAADGSTTDLIDGKPTGVVRVSLGKDSIWEDVDALVTFIQTRFVTVTVTVTSNTSTSTSRRKKTPPLQQAQEDASEYCSNDGNKKTPSPQEQMGLEYYISELYVYPIKSCAAMRISISPQHQQSWRLDSNSSTGGGRLEWDREFALVDSSGHAMRLYAYPQMAHIQPRISTSLGTGDTRMQIMTVTAPGCEPLVLQLDTVDAPKQGCEDCKSKAHPPTEECQCWQHVSNSNSKPWHTVKGAGAAAVAAQDLKVCGNLCRGTVFGNEGASEWFSRFLGVKCWLVRHYQSQENQTRNKIKPQPAAAVSMDVSRQAKHPSEEEENDDHAAMLNERQTHNTTDATVSTVIGKKDQDRIDIDIAARRRHEAGVAFANEAPILAISQHSVDRLNGILKRQHQPLVQSKHFRPNLVVGTRRRSRSARSFNTSTNNNNDNRSGGLPDAELQQAQTHTHINPEDSWKELHVLAPSVTAISADGTTLTADDGYLQSFSFSVSGPCARCQSKSQAQQSVIQTYLLYCTIGPSRTKRHYSMSISIFHVLGKRLIYPRVYLFFCLCFLPFLLLRPSSLITCQSPLNLRKWSISTQPREAKEARHCAPFRITDDSRGTNVDQGQEEEIILSLVCFCS